MTTQRPFVIAVSQATRACGSCPSMPSSTASETWSQTLSGCPSVTDSEVRRNERDELKDVVTSADHNLEIPPPLWEVFFSPHSSGGGGKAAGGAGPEGLRRRCDVASLRGPGRAAAPGARRCHRARGRCAALPGDDPRSRPPVRDGAAAMRPADHRCGPDRGPGPPRATGGSGRARVASTGGRGDSFSPEHLHPPGRRDSGVHLVEGGQVVGVGGAAIRLEGDGVTWAREMATAAIPPKLARKVGADRRDG